MAEKSQSPLRVAVLGTGSLGQHHARIYAEMAAAGAVTFTGVFDQNPEAARTHATKHNVRAFASIEEAADASDALNIVTPTTTHFEIAKQLIARGKHVLIEKPMTYDVAQADELIHLAATNRCLIQVGHIERFNPVFPFLQSAAPEPRFIEAHRLSPHPGRSTDVGVVLDLMIHDLDIVLALVDSPVVQIDVAGLPVLGETEDIANARLKFANGCVANLTASRVSADRMRKIRVFSGGARPGYVSVDYRTQEGFIYRVAGEGEPDGAVFQNFGDAKDAAVTSQFAGKKILCVPAPITKDEPLKLELRHFVECVREGRTPLVDGAAGRRALELAFEITQKIRSQPLDGPEVPY